MRSLTLVTLIMLAVAPANAFELTCHGQYCSDDQGRSWDESQFGNQRIFHGYDNQGRSVTLDCMDSGYSLDCGSAGSLHRTGPRNNYLNPDDYYNDPMHPR
jgi:hypothetical protein